MFKQSTRTYRKRSSSLFPLLSKLQSTLVISTLIISNNRLSRRENLVLVLTQKSKIRLQNIVEKMRNCSWSNFSPFLQYFQYIFLGVQQYGKKRIAIYCNMANPYCNTYWNMLCSTIPTDMWHTWPLIWNPKGNSRKIVHLHGILYSIFPR